MIALPQEYKVFAEKINTILRIKPKRGYIESIVENGKPDPLDPLEEVSMSIAIGNKNKSIQTLKSALEDNEKLEILSYLSNTEKRLQSFIEELEALPEIDKSKPDANTSSRLPLIAVGIVAIVAITTMVSNFL